MNAKRVTTPAADIDTIETRLVELAGAQKTGWQEIARLMILVKEGDLYRPHADNFTQWVRNVALRAGVHESNYWRYHRAGTYYLHVTRNQGNLDALDGARIAAESLELLEKISRHAPAAAAEELVERAMRGELARNELRSIWHEYRPAQLQTARGSGKSGPGAGTDQGKATAAAMIQALNSDRTWAFAQAYRLASFSQVAVRTGSTRHARRIDYVLLYQSAQWDLDPFLVGVEVKVTCSDLANDQKMSEYLPFVHTFFLAVPDGPSFIDAAHEHTTPEIGILAVDIDRLQVRVERQPAKCNASDALLVSETYRSLLLKNLAWTQV